MGGERQKGTGYMVWAWKVKSVILAALYPIRFPRFDLPSQINLDFHGNIAGTGPSWLTMAAGTYLRSICPVQWIEQVREGRLGKGWEEWSGDKGKEKSRSGPGWVWLVAHLPRPNSTSRKNLVLCYRLSWSVLSWPIAAAETWTQMNKEHLYFHPLR